KPLTPSLQHGDKVSSACFSPDGRWVLTASADLTARLWSANSGEPFGMPMKHEDAVLWAQFSPDCQRVLTASEDKAARLWDLPTVTDKDTAEEIRLLADLARSHE
ncbi:MAG TPA: hypothetical protein VNY04_04675, partial [Chthoniobacterales bacterium]|nr:hypothetical protein [Chthoniobacterales bacterium]